MAEHVFVGIFGNSCLSIPRVARPLNVRPGFSRVYDKHEIEALADWVGGCRGGNLGVEGDTPYLVRHWPVFVASRLRAARC